MENKLKNEQKYEYFPDFRDTKIKLHIFEIPLLGIYFDPGCPGPTSLSLNCGCFSITKLKKRAFHDLLEHFCENLLKATRNRSILGKSIKLLKK